MYLYEKLEELIGTEVELFENRNTGRLEIRPSEGEGKKAPQAAISVMWEKITFW